MTVLTGVGVVAVAGAAIAMSSSGPDNPNDLEAQRLVAQRVGEVSISALTQTRTNSDAAYADSIPREVREGLERAGARADEARVMASGQWGRLAVFPTNRDAACFSIESSESPGIVNCPALDAVRAGLVTLPLWDKGGQDIGWVGVVSDGFRSVTNPATGRSVPVENNTFVFREIAQPTALVYERTNGERVTATRR